MSDDLTRKPLDQWTADDIATAAAAGLPPTYAVARAMLEDHDYFGGTSGSLWVGERAESGLTAEQMRRIKNVFIADPVLEEVRETRTNGLLQREASVSFAQRAPTESDADTDQAEDERISVTVKALAGWWDRVKFWDKVRLAFGRGSYARRVVVRAFIPQSNLIDQTAEDGTPQKAFPPASTLEGALSRIEIEAPLPSTAGRFTLVTQQHVAVIVTGDEEHRIAELWSVENGQTVVRVPATFGNRMAGARGLTLSYDLGGRLPICEMTSPELVTEPIIRQQGLLNLQSTVLNCATGKAGFPERYIKNAEPPGLWLSYPPDDVPITDVEQDKDINGSPIYKHRRPWVFGFTQVAEILGIKQKEIRPDGTEVQGYMTPDVTRFEPVDPDYVIKAMNATKNRIYHLCRQGHLANDSTAETSGLAYQQARAQHEADLLTQKGGLEGVVRDVLEVVLAYAGLMHGETKTFLEEFRAVVTMHVTSGPLTPGEAQEVRANKDAGLLSLETAMGRIGVEDIAAELAAIARDPGANADQWVKIAAAITALTTISGMSGAAAAFLLGLDEEQQAVFLTGAPPVTGQAITKPTLAA